MTRSTALSRLLVIALIAVLALAGCTIATVSPIPEPVAEATATVPKLEPTETATSAPIPMIVQAAPTRTATPVPTATPTSPPPAPTWTPAPPTATSTAMATQTSKAESTPTKAATAQAPKATATKKPATATPATPKATATSTAAKPATGKVVGLDPGHHRIDVGGSSLYGVKEYKLTMETALAVRQILIANGYTVRMSRWNDNPVSSWSSANSTERIRIEQQARIRAVGAVSAYVPIHFNASPSHTLKGTETYYNSSTAVGARSVALARSIQASVVSRITGAGYATVNRGAKSDLSAGKPYGHMFSLSGPYPSAMIESLFMDQPADAAALQKSSVRAAIARGIAEGIMNFLE